MSQPAAMRPRGPRPPTTPAQHARLAIANAQAREALNRVQQLDPHWRPPQSLTSRDNRDDVEVTIRAKEAETREAEARFMALSLARQDGPYPGQGAPILGEVFAPRGERVGYASRYDREVRIVAPAEFEALRLDAMRGARQVEPDAGYRGVWYKREDGSIFGLRLSADHGLTLDVIRSDHPIIRPGFKVHQR